MPLRETKEERERREAIELALETGSVGILNQAGIIVKPGIQVPVEPIKQTLGK